MIESTRNPRVVRAAKLHRVRNRRETGETLLEGPNVIGAALAAGLVPDLVFTLDRNTLADRAAGAGSEVVSVTEAVMSKLAGTENPRGPVAIVAIPESGLVAPVDTIVLCGINDPGNAGTLIRSAAAFSFQVVATIPVGYSDGYPYDVIEDGEGPAEVLIRGRRCPLVGLVTANHVVADVTEVDGVEAGDEAVLFGRQGNAAIEVEEVAAWARTSAYKILIWMSPSLPRASP